VLFHDPALSSIVERAFDRLVTGAVGKPFPETVFAFRDGVPLLVASTTLGGRLARSLLGTAAPISRADALLFVADTRVQLDGEPCEAMIALVLPYPDASGAELMVHPYQSARGTPVRREPVKFGRHDAIFGVLVDDLTVAWPLDRDVERIAALQQLHQAGAELELAPELDDEIVALLARR
jgi:hypothetical protein